MSTLTAPTRPPLAPHRAPATHHRRVIERTVTVTRELVVDGGEATGIEAASAEATGLDRLVLRLALWMIERRRIRSLRPRVDSAEMSHRVDAARQHHIDRYHGLPF